MTPTRLPIIGQSLAPSPLERVVRAGLEAVGSTVVVEHWERRPHELGPSLSEVRAAEEFAGALIVSPHREKAPALADALSDDARASGAVNVLARSDGRLRGHNTDMDGVRAGLREILPRVKGKWPRNAVVLGAGGGGRAVVAVLIGSGFQRIAVLNRHLHRAEALAAYFSRASRHMELRARPWHDAILEAELARAELLVNAAALGGDADDSLIPADAIPPDRYVLDMAVETDVTPLMRDARERGGTVANGRGAFLAGCARAVRILTGTAPPLVPLRAALAAELGVPEADLAGLGD